MVAGEQSGSGILPLCHQRKAAGQARISPAPFDSSVYDEPLFLV
jgi:hypothetical protein